jgi:lysophospholipase L1-like esterase
MLTVPQKLISGVLGTVGPWNATRDALKAQIQNFGAAPSTSALSPTFTLGVANAAATVTGSLIAVSNSAFRYVGADPYVPSSFPDNLGYKFWNVSTDGTSGISTHAYINQTNAFGYDKQTLEIRCKGNGAKLRLLVDGQYTATQFAQLPNDGQGYYYKVDFGSAAARQLKIESNGNFVFWGIQKETAATISAPTDALRLRMVMAGDSFTEGTGATNSGDSLVHYAGKLLGFDDRYDSGSGGTGWVQINGSRVALPARLQQDVINRDGDMVVLAMGLNDEGDGNDAACGTACAAAISSIRAASPAVMIYVVGPWDPSAPGATPANRTNMRNVLRDASTGRGGVKFLDPLGVEFGKIGDNTHPNDAGHVTLGTWLADQVKADLGIA